MYLIIKGVIRTEVIDYKRLKRQGQMAAELPSNHNFQFICSLAIITRTQDIWTVWPKERECWLRMRLRSITSTLELAQTPLIFGKHTRHPFVLFYKLDILHIRRESYQNV